MIKISHYKKLSLVIIPGMLICLCLIASLFLIFSKQNSQALSVQDFKAGNIIDDSVFYDKNSMNAQDIQNFFNQKVPSCKTWNPVNVVDGAGVTVGPPYVCITNYYENPTTNETSFEKGGGAFEGGISAAQIFYNAAQKYGVNPQVLLTLLMKESYGPLTRDDWPTKFQYSGAMGYDCPDNRPCNPKSAGLYKQVMNSAWQLNYYRENIYDYNYKPYQVNSIGYYPDPIGTTTPCGRTDVYIENIATASLYIYTPYVPNQAAINAYPGTGDRCSSYGNRNFFMMFSQNFGSTHGNNFKPLEAQRWMQVKNDNTFKMDIFSGQKAGGALSAGQQIKFMDKIQINGKWYLRTEYNYNDNGNYGIEHNQLTEISYNKITPKWVTIVENGNSSHPASRISTNDILQKGTTIKVVDDIKIDGNTYYRTEYNSRNNRDFGIHSRFLTKGILPLDLEGPRNFCPAGTAKRIDIASGKTISTVKDSVYINKKIFYAGSWHFQLSADNGTSTFINSSSLRNSDCARYEGFDNPRNMTIKQTVDRIDPFTGKKIDTLVKGRIVHFSSKILIDNQWYFRTTSNTQEKIDAAVPASYIGEL